MFQYHVRIVMTTCWGQKVKTMLLLLPLLLLCEVTGAMSEQNPTFGFGSDDNIPQVWGRRLPKYPAEMRNILRPLDSILRYQRSQQNSRRQLNQDYPQPLVHEIPLEFTRKPPAGYNLNRRRALQKPSKAEMRQRQIAVLEASDLIKNPAQVKKMLKVFLTELRNRVNANPHLSKKIEEIMAARMAASAAGIKPDQQQEMAPQPLPPDLAPPEPPIVAVAPEDIMQQPDDTVINSQQAPVEPLAAEEDGEGGENPDSAELRRSLCHFKLCPLWRKPWQDN